jgi:ABC-type multidrug transport system fused ATPase/permease subunit
MLTTQTAISVFGGMFLGKTPTDRTEFRFAITSVPQLLTDALQEIVSVQRISAFLQRPDVQYLDESESASTVAEESKPLVVVGDIAWAELQEGMSLDSAPFVLRDLDITFQRGTVTLIAGKFGSGMLNALLGEVALLRGRISYAVSSVVDPWQVETAIDWGQCLEGLAFVPQASRANSLSRPELITRLPGSRA